MSNVVTTYWWRHGETDWNARRKWQGHTDIPLNDKGLKQAHELGRNLCMEKMEFILSSDLSRATKTAEIIAGYLDLHMLELPALREGHFGRAEGLTIDEIRKKFGSRLLEDWRSPDKNLMDIRFANGESKREILARVMSEIESQLLSLPFKVVGISTHGGIIRKVLNFLEPELKLPSPIPNCRCYELSFDRDKKNWKVIATP